MSHGLYVYVCVRIFVIPLRELPVSHPYIECQRYNTMNVIRTMQVNDRTASIGSAVRESLMPLSIRKA